MGWNKSLYASHGAVIQCDTTLDTSAKEYEFQLRDTNLISIASAPFKILIFTEIALVE